MPPPIELRGVQHSIVAAASLAAAIIIIIIISIITVIIIINIIFAATATAYLPAFLSIRWRVSFHQRQPAVRYCSAVNP